MPPDGVTLPGEELPENERGDCFTAALGIAEVMEAKDVPFRFLVVHGTPIFRGEGGDGVARFWHAWVELHVNGEWKVADYANGREFLMARREYYRIGGITERHVWRYTPLSARAEVARNDQSAGPWVLGWKEMAH